MDKNSILIEISDFVKEKQTGEESGHDWWHTYRVVKLTRYLAEEEGADLFISELGALLHDIADWKFMGGNDKASSKVAIELLNKYNVDQKTIDHVCHIVDNVSYKGQAHKNGINTIEGMVVQDADRLDALGAIGVARTFAFGGSDGRELYNPEKKPSENMSFEEYKNNKSSSINHFYEKLLLIKDRLNTESAQRIAAERHQFMLDFLDEFYKEWDNIY